MNKISVLSLTCLVALLSTSCSSVRIASRPAGAKIYFNGEDTGLLTPAAVRVTKLPKGNLDVELRKDGYVSDGRQMSVRTSVGKIIWSIVPPVLIDAACDKWRTVRPGRVSLRLKPVPAPSAMESISAVSVEEKLSQLTQLRDKNVLTEAEYQKKRQQIIDRF